MYIESSEMLNINYNIIHLLEFLLIPLWYIFNSVNKQVARIIHTTANSAAMVVAEMAQAANN